MAETDEFMCQRSPKYPFRDIICYCDSNFSIQVFDLHKELFIPDIREVHFFGDDHGDELAFETINYCNQSVSFIISAIKWYAEYLNYKQMKIYKYNPI